MKISLAVVVALAASAQAFNPAPQQVDWSHLRIGHAAAEIAGIARDAIPEPEANEIGLAGKFRIGHTGVARDALPEPEVAPEVVERKHHGHPYHYEYQNAPIFVEAGRVPPRPENGGPGHKDGRPCHGKHGKPFGGLVSSILHSLGFGGSPDFSRGLKPVTDYHRDEHRPYHGHHGKKPEGEAEMVNILPIFGEDASHKQIESWLAAGTEEPKAKKPHHHTHHHEDDDDEKHHHKHHGHKHHDKEGKKLDGKKGHKHHHHHGHKHHKGGKVAGILAHNAHKLCDALANLPPALRGFVIGAVVGAVIQVVFSLVFLAIRLRRRGCAASREARRERRKERKEARKAAKAAYKASKAARNAKATEAGFDIEEEGEALPSYAEGEADALVVRA